MVCGGHWFGWGWTGLGWIGMRWDEMGLEWVCRDEVTEGIGLDWI